MAYSSTPVFHTSKAGAAASTTVTNSLDSTGADLIIIGVAANALLTGVSDSKSNVWIPLTVHGSGNGESWLFYCQNPTVGSGHTFTATGAGSMYAPVTVVGFSGSATTPADGENGASYTSKTTIATGSLTPSQDGDLIIAHVGGGAGSSLTIDSSFTISDSINFVNNVSFFGGIAYLVQGTAAAVNPAWSWTTSSSSGGASIAAFKAAAGGAMRPVKMAGRWGGYAGASGGFAA